jgi:hypothetical protein
MQRRRFLRTVAIGAAGVGSGPRLPLHYQAQSGRGANPSKGDAGAADAVAGTTRAEALDMIDMLDKSIGIYQGKM